VASNVWLVRAELVDFWRLLLQHNTITVKHHYLLYPNPYPKTKRVKSRWYAHPSFPLLLQVASEKTIVRSNWELYLQEFASAVEIVDKNITVDAITSIEPADTTKTKALTNFERKYWAAREPTYELILQRR